MTRRRSLAGRLSRALAACVALALIVMVAASTLVMRSWMLGNMDSELHRLSQRAGEHLDVEDAPDDEVDADDDSDDDSDEGPRAVQQSGGRVPRPGGPVVPGGPKGPGFGGSGIAEGTLQYVSEDGQAAGAVVSNFSVTYLNEPALEILAHVPTDGAPHTVHLKELGTFRVTARVIDGKTILVGVQMDSVDDVVMMLVAVEVGLSLVVAIAAGFAGRAWVRRELRVSLHGGQGRTQFMGGIGDELAQLRLAAGAALHAVFDRVDHRVQGTRDIRDLDGAGGGLLSDAGQLLGVVG